MKCCRIFLVRLSHVEMSFITIVLEVGASARLVPGSFCDHLKSKGRNSVMRPKIFQCDVGNFKKSKNSGRGQGPREAGGFVGPLPEFSDF